MLCMIGGEDGGGDADADFVLEDFVVDGMVEELTGSTILELKPTIGFGEQFFIESGETMISDVVLVVNNEYQQVHTQSTVDCNV